MNHVVESPSPLAQMGFFGWKLAKNETNCRYVMGRQRSGCKDEVVAKCPKSHDCGKGHVLQ